MLLESKTIKIRGNDDDGYMIYYHNQLVRKVQSLEIALDIAVALIADDYDILQDYGIHPQEVISFER